MNDRQVILEAIKRNKPQPTILPEIPGFNGGGQGFLQRFEASLATNSGASLRVNTVEEINTYINNRFTSALQICSLVEGVVGNVDITTISDPHQLSDLDLAIIKGELGVAENAAVWISEKTMVIRVLPVITQHLILVLDKKDIVENMHDAYQKIKINESGYGVFIAGPSKTADIEQSLVIGAHGSRSLTVALI